MQLRFTSGTFTRKGLRTRNEKKRLGVQCWSRVLGLQGTNISPTTPVLAFCVIRSRVGPANSSFRPGRRLCRKPSCVLLRGHLACSPRRALLWIQTSIQTHRRPAPSALQEEMYVFGRVTRNCTCAFCRSPLLAHHPSNNVQVRTNRIIRLLGVRRKCLPRSTRSPVPISNVRKGKMLRRAPVTSAVRLHH